MGTRPSRNTYPHIMELTGTMLVMSNVSGIASERTMNNTPKVCQRSRLAIQRIGLDSSRLRRRAARRRGPPYFRKCTQPDLEAARGPFSCQARGTSAHAAAKNTQPTRLLASSAFQYEVGPQAPAL